MSSFRDYIRTITNGVVRFTVDKVSRLKKEWKDDLYRLELDVTDKLRHKLDKNLYVPQVQADWNTPDSGLPSYILNRPFYDDYVMVDVTYTNVRTSGQSAVSIGTFPGMFIAGATYRVSVNGSVEMMTASTSDKLVRTSGYVGFILYKLSDEYDLQAYTWWSSGATIVISGPVRCLKQIDPKFLNCVTSLNGKTGDVTYTADDFGSIVATLESHILHSYSYRRRWLGLDSSPSMGLCLGDIRIFGYDGSDGNHIVEIVHVTNTSAQVYSTRDVILHGVADPTQFDEAANKNYVDKLLKSHIKDEHAPTNEMILISSTEGSEKKFRITVDDSGTIAATEVVNV